MTAKTDAPKKPQSAKRTEEVQYYHPHTEPEDRNCPDCGLQEPHHRISCRWHMEED
jgi:hypothetical protein